LDPPKDPTAEKRVCEKGMAGFYSRVSWEEKAKKKRDREALEQWEDPTAEKRVCEKGMAGFYSRVSWEEKA
jgi:hypothetical protein